MATQPRLDQLQAPYKFSAYRSAALNTGTGYNVINHDTKVFDTGTNFDVTTNKGRFTAPAAGFYQFNWAAGASGAVGAAGANNIQTALYKNGAIAAQGSFADMRDTEAGANTISNGSEVLQLSAGDFVEVYIRCSAGAVAMAVGQAYNRFSGYLISAT